MFFKSLQKAKKKKELVSVVVNEEDGFWCGYIIEVNKSVFKMKHFTKYGVPDGEIIEKLENITCIERKDDYIKCMQYVINNSEKIQKKKEEKINAGSGEFWQEETLKSLVGKNESVVRLEVQEDEYRVGLVNKVKKGFFEMHCIGRSGDDEGVSIYACAAVKLIRVNDIDARKRLLLYNWKKNTLKK